MTRAFGPLIVERRAKKPRRCLGCNRSFITTNDRRLCERCRESSRNEAALPDYQMAWPGRKR